VVTGSPPVQSDHLGKLPSERYGTLAVVAIFLRDEFLAGQQGIIVLDPLQDHESHGVGDLECQNNHRFIQLFMVFLSCNSGQAVCVRAYLPFSGE
jgi:hypothetical protein